MGAVGESGGDEGVGAPLPADVEACDIAGFSAVLGGTGSETRALVEAEAASTPVEEACTLEGRDRDAPALAEDVFEPGPPPCPGGRGAEGAPDPPEMAGYAPLKGGTGGGGGAV